jgi:membrane protein
LPASAAGGTASPPSREAEGHHSFSFATLWRFLLRASNAWMGKHATSKSAALAFYTIFSLAPALVLVVALAGLVFGQKAAEGEIISQLGGLIGLAGAEAVQAVLASARKPAEGTLATAIAALVLFIGATTMFAELKDSLDDLWDVETPEGSTILDILRARLLSFSLVLVLGFLLLVSLALSAALAMLSKYWQGLFPSLQTLLETLSGTFSFLVIAALFAVIYKMLPSVKVPWRSAFLGAFLSATLFMIGKHLIGLYIGNVGVTSSFGAAGALVVLLIWVYYSAQILFFGAAVSRELSRPPPPEP